MISFSRYILLEGQLEDHFVSKGVEKQDAKDAISRWRGLTPKQKEQVPNPQKYQDLKSFINDLENAEKFVSKTAKEKQVKQSGIKGLTKGEDYLEFETGNPEVQAYAPLNWGASKLIASKDVGSCEGKWCTAYQKSAQHWVEFIDDEEGALIYLVTPETKYAVLYLEYEGIVGWELFDEDDESYDMYLTEVEFPEIYPIVDGFKKHYKEIREHFSPSWDDIIDADDVESFAERYKENPEAFNKGFLMKSIISSRADQCLDWLLENVALDDDAISRGLWAIMNSDENTSEKMKDRFMRILDKLPYDENVMVYDYLVDVIDGATISAEDTDFYFDTILNDERFNYEGSEFREGTFELFELYIEQYHKEYEDLAKKLLAKVDQKKKELDRTE